jgi:hypothetical protein
VTAETPAAMSAQSRLVRFSESASEASAENRPENAPFRSFQSRAKTAFQLTFEAIPEAVHPSEPQTR